MLDVLRGKEQRPVHFQEFGRPRTIRAIEVLHDHRACRRAVALHQLGAFLAVKGRKKQCSVDIGRTRAQFDIVVHEDSACGRPIALP